MPIKKSNRVHKGFTIIELVIYSALVAIVIGGSLGAVYQIISSSEKLNGTIIREQEIRFIMDKINWALTDVSVVSSPPENATSSILSVSKQSFSQNPIVFQLSGDAITLQQGANPTLPLHSNIMQVENLNFSYEVTTTTPNFLTVRFTVSGREYKTKTYIQK
ncbi:MAG: hypothetical protein UX14_C0005G0020 [Parcubacteria group bacterium GW2011_GWF1_45_5]|nr:MAG: hypothetical protein UX14_C0005G0020 [Parcubacteria group bacterium GW2011_GWF1_45_5]